VKHKIWFFVPIFALCLACSVAHAQDGFGSDGPCTDSPENPTAILALVGTTGAGLAALRVRFRARGQKKP
jgi:XrtJ-associated TM-motif-TM protein